MKIIRVFLLSGLVLAGVYAQNQINAIKVPGNVGKIDPESKAWLSAEYTDVILYPHTTIKINNSETSSPIENKKAKKARIKALYDGENISLLIEWSDTTKDVQKECSSKKEADGFAFQFPLDFSDGAKLPYISMGSKDRAVMVHLQNATEKAKETNAYDGTHFKELKEYFNKLHTPIKKQVKDENGSVFIMEGPRSIKKSQEEAALVTMNMIYKDGIWKGTLSRPLKTENLDLEKGAFPISLITWDGSLDARDSAEYLSSWIGVKLIEERGGNSLFDILKSQAHGSIYNGRKLTIENCASCHNFADNFIAAQHLAPDLSNVGGYSTTQYLMESITDPSAVVISNYKSKIQPSLPWYSLDSDGNLISSMPSYDWMDEKSKEDIVAYLKTLKAKVQE